MSRELRRYKNYLAIQRQVRIRKMYNWISPTFQPGKYRKHYVNNCGRSGCMLCVNPRRTWGRISLQEVSANEALAYEHSQQNTAHGSLLD